MLLPSVTRCRALGDPETLRPSQSAYRQVSISYSLLAVLHQHHASDEEIIDACKKARIHDFIMTLPDKYNTYIGERGVKLSGGQKQRVSIARIFLKNPPIMILDEATSALDNVTENEIQKSLEELGKNRTNLVVAHRLSTIKNADEIIVLTENGIEERGTHQELVEKNGIYSKLNKK